MKPGGRHIWPGGNDAAPQALYRGIEEMIAVLRIAIAEDDAMYARQLTEYLRQYERERNLETDITVYSDGDELAEGYRPRFDIILMDVEMPFMDGMTAAGEIRRQDPEVVIIFITNMPQYAIQGYAVDALDYVLKPISYFAFSQRLDRAISRMKKREAHFFTIPAKGGAQKLDISRLCYVESQGHSLQFHTTDGVISSSGTMQDLEEKLGAFHFFRGNKGYLINLDHVDSVQDGCALVRGERLVLSRSRKNAFLEALADHVGGTIK